MLYCQSTNNKCAGHRFDLGSGAAVIRSPFLIAADSVHIVNATR